MDRTPTGAILDTLAILEPPPASMERLGLPSGALELRRAWPDSSGHLRLEYITSTGGIIAAQWFSEAKKLERIARATAQASPALPVVVLNGGEGRVLLHGKGADRRLPGLAPLLLRPEARLLVHRPEQRAVVRLKTSAGPAYAKVVPPKRVQALAAAGSAARDRAGDAFLAPKPLEVDVSSGVVIWSPLPGVSLYDLSNSERLIPAAWGMGRALKAWHAASPVSNIMLHNASAEVEVVQRWLKRLEAFAPDLYHLLCSAAPQVFDALVAASSPPVLLHRDFYDKQVFIDGSGRVGLLDFDTLASGEAALDLANALIHFELRSLQGYYSPGRAAAAAAAMIEGYQPSPAVQQRLGPYADGTRLRLACVYAFRPHGASLIPSLFSQIGRPVIGTV